MTTTYPTQRREATADELRRRRLRQQDLRVQRRIAEVDDEVAFRSVLGCSPWCRSCRRHVAARGPCPGVRQTAGEAGRDRPICRVDRITGRWESAWLRDYLAEAVGLMAYLREPDGSRPGPV